MGIPARTVVAGPLAILLLAIVAAASAGNPLSLPLRTGYVDRRQLVLLAAAIITAVLTLSFIAALIVQHAIRRHRQQKPRPRDALLRATPIAVALAGIVCLAAISRVQMQAEQEAARLTDRADDSGQRGRPMGMTDDRAPPVVAGEEEQEEDPGATRSAEPQPERTPFERLLIFAVLVALLFLAAAAWLALRAPARRTGTPAESADRAVHDALVATIQSMLTDPEPRTAVIGAYARLLENLAQCGLARREHEAPLEHVRRTLQRVHVKPEPIRRLIELFERARFSSHRVTPEHREQALQALREAAHDIASLASLRQQEAGG